MNYSRLLAPEKYKNSSFIFGPRMTGKTSLLRKIPTELFIDLLDPEEELAYRANPKLLYEKFLSLREGATVVIDEVQKLPIILDYVQKAIENRKLKFLLSGSSARKLKRGAANLLGGRALDLRLHTLTHLEIGSSFNIDTAIKYGTLPKIYSLASQGLVDEAKLLLKSYYTTYIKEEIQAEAIVRNLSGFQRFLPIAAASDAKIIEYKNIGVDCSVPDSTVKDFFSILEDTLIGKLLWPWNRSERKKSRPKFYLFDTGVSRMLLNRLTDPPTSSELGFLFESWFINEVQRLKDYFSKGDELSFWRSGDYEVDLVVHTSKDFRMAIEIKSGKVTEEDSKPLLQFAKIFPNVPLIIASLKETEQRVFENGIVVLPWKEALKRFLELCK